MTPGVAGGRAVNGVSKLRSVVSMNWLVDAMSCSAVMSWPV